MAVCGSSIFCRITTEAITGCPINRGSNQLPDCSALAVSVQQLIGLGSSTSDQPNMYQLINIQFDLPFTIIIFIGVLEAVRWMKAFTTPNTHLIHTCDHYLYLCAFIGLGTV